MFGQLVGALYRCHAGQPEPKPGQESELSKPKVIQGLRRKDEDQIILHRDLKPENVFLTNGSTVKLGDFGLSKLLSAHDFASTYVGTPFYMSPEICSSERYSGKSDIWSLGCIIYELCALEPPFNARNHLELIQKIRLGRVKALPTCFSKELGQVIAWCLKVNPDERPDTAQLLQVTNIKFARMKLESELVYTKGVSDREELVKKAERFEKENQALRQEIERLKSTEAHLKMEYHTKATLWVDEKVNVAKANLEAIFEKEVEKRTEQKLAAHLASLPAAQGVTVSVRSSTPPPEKQQPGSSFDTVPSTLSSPERTAESGDIDTDLTSLSLGDDVSPLAQRTKPIPRKTGRTPFTRARTVADYPGSPMDVSPTAPSSLRGLALSPGRRNKPTEGVARNPLRRNIFAEAAKTQDPPSSKTAALPPMSEMNEVDTSFADDIFEDDEPESPSRPNSGFSNHNGDPFKALAAPQAPGLAANPARKPRPSLGRQKTMPVQMPQASHVRRNTFLTQPTKPPTTEKEKENRPPSSHLPRTQTVPVLSTATSPKRNPVPPKKELTPSRQAPKAPGNKTPLGAARKAGDLMKHAQRNALQGRTLVELSQAPGLTSPVKWDAMVEQGEVMEMPSPFLARKGRAMA